MEAAMDFHALSRRELQALCKRNGVRANMTNAAMADALQVLDSVDGVDEIGTTLCLPTPGRSAMKSAAKAGEEQQHGSPLPRGRRVSVMSPAAVQLDMGEGDDERKRDLVKEIVKTPGAALRSTSRRARATPAPLPTPTTLRRSQRTAARKAPAPVEEVSNAKRSTRRASARSKLVVDMDREEEVQQEEPIALVSDVKSDEPEEEDEDTKILGGDNKEEEPEEGDEADSSGATNGSALLSDKSRGDLKVEEVVAVEQEATKPEEETLDEQEPISAQKSTPLAPVEDSPILGVLSKAEAIESVIAVAEDASVDDGEGVAEWSPVKEMIVETEPGVKDKVEAISEVAVKGDGFTVAGEAVHSPKEIISAATGEDETGEEDLIEEKEGSDDEMQQSEEETSDELDEDEEPSSDDDEASEEIDSTDESEGDCTEVRADFDNVKELVQKMQGTEIAVKASEGSAEKVSEEDGSADEDGSGDEEDSEDGSDDGEEVSEDGATDKEANEEDDFTSDLSSEFDDIEILSDAETESDTTSPVASATKTSVKSLDESAISVTNKEELSEEKDAIEGAMKKVDNTVETIVKSLDECTIEEGTQQTEEEKLNIRAEAVGHEGKKMDYSTMSLRKLRATVKKAEEGKKHGEGKRLPLEVVDDNACADS